MQNNMEECIYYFIKRHHHKKYLFSKPPILTLDTDLDINLGIRKSNEASKLMDAFFQEFNVDRNNFTIETYYQPYPTLLESLNPFKVEEMPITPNLTIGMLVASAKSGRWLYNEKGKLMEEEETIDNIEEAIYDLVRYFYVYTIYRKTPELKKETDLNEDLIFEEDESEDFMNCFFEEFKVDKGSFDIKTYYPTDIYDVYFLIVYKKKQGAIVPALNIGKLIESAKAGIWLYDEKGMLMNKNEAVIASNIKKSIYNLIEYYYRSATFRKKELVLNRETDLHNNNLMFTVNEVEDLMNDFFKELKVDKGSFSINTYYPQYNKSILYYLNPFKKVKVPKVPAFTINMLIESAKAGKWLYDEKGNKITQNK